MRVIVSNEDGHVHRYVYRPNYLFKPLKFNVMNEEMKSDAQRIDESAESVESKVYASKKLARFFELEVNLRVFGQLVWSWKFPPQKS